MNNKTHRVIHRIVLDIELEKDVSDLATKVAGRAYTIQGVSNCEVVIPGEDFQIGQPAISFAVDRSPPTFWDRCRMTLLKWIL